MVVVVLALEVQQLDIVPYPYDNDTKFIVAYGLLNATNGIVIVTRLSHIVRKVPSSRNVFCHDVGIIVVPNNRVTHVDISGGPTVIMCG